MNKITSVIAFFFAVIQPVLTNDNSNNYIKLGGAFRINLVSTNYEQPVTTLNNYATLDTWRINVDAKYSGIKLDFEYRFYPTYNTHFIHHGYLGYDFSDKLNLQLGITQVPFGNLTYNSHSWWFLIPYYLGLEDDYDLGIKFTWKPATKLDIQVAYFRQAEPAGPSYGKASFGGPAAGTYSYNIIPDNEGILSETGAKASIHELNQFNLRIAYKLFSETTIGISAQSQGIYNSVLNEIEYGYALSTHLNSNFSNFNLKLQHTTYDYRAKDDTGNLLNRVQMGAYGDPYYNDGVAARADILTAGISYNIPVKWGPISSVLPYFNYSVMLKKGTYNYQNTTLSFVNSIMAVPGIMLTAGKVYTYIDLAVGKNQPWLTDSFGTGLGKGHSYSNQPTDYYYNLSRAGQAVPTQKLKWNYRFNINIGYYF